MTTTPASGPTPTHRSRWLVPLLLVAGLGLVAAAATGVALTRGGDESAQDTAAQVSQVQDSCRGWMTSAEADGLADDQWCTDMFAWMEGQSGGSMMGSMMWRGPEQMGAACRAWVEDSAVGPVLDDQRGCDGMVAWMDGHMSTRGGTWMMRGR